MEDRIDLRKSMGEYYSDKGCTEGYVARERAAQLAYDAEPS